MKATLASLATPATVTTTLGALLSVGIGVAGAAGLLHLPVGLDTLFLGAGLGALLGHNPVAPAA